MTKNTPLLSSRPPSESMALFLLLISAMLFSIMGIFLKRASNDTFSSSSTSSNNKIPSTELVFIRAMFQGSLTLIGLFFLEPINEAQGKQTQQQQIIMTTIDKQKQKQTNKTVKLIRYPYGGTPYVQKIVLLRGFLGGLGFVCYFYSMKTLPLGDAVTLFSLYPIITLFLARIFLKELFTVHKIMTAVASVIGAILITKPTFIFGNDGVEEQQAVGQHFHTGHLTALIGSFFGASVITMIRIAGKSGVHTFQLLISWATFGVLSSVIFGFLWSDTYGNGMDGDWNLHIFSFNENRETCIDILFMVVLGSMAHFLFNFAGKYAPASLGSIARSSDILFAYIFQVVIFHQVPTIGTFIGSFLILISIASIALLKVRQSQDQRNQNEKETIQTKNNRDNTKQANGEHLLLLSGNHNHHQEGEKEDNQYHDEPVLSYECDSKSGGNLHSYGSA